MQLERHAGMLTASRRDIDGVSQRYRWRHTDMLMASGDDGDDIL